MQSKIVLHFISKEVPQEALLSLQVGGSLLTSMLTVKKSSGVLVLVHVMPLGELA